MSQDGLNNCFNAQNYEQQTTTNDHQLWRREPRRRSPNTTPVLNSPDLTEVHNYRLYKHQIKLGRSPVGQLNDDDSITPISPESPVLNASASASNIVFDDIGESWRQYAHDNTNQNIDPGSCDTSKSTKIIDYDGSPRKFGIIYPTELNNDRTQTAAKLLLPKPGFPQRVTSPALNKPESPTNPASPNETKFNTNDTIISKNCTFDYLYEFSETRKVLEDFFKSPDDSIIPLDYNDSEVEFDRSNSDNAYIGQRLSNVSTSAQEFNDSPRNLITTNYEYQNTQISEADNNEYEFYLDSNSRSSGELADTELDPNLRGTSRNFTISPESIDYDSNCGDVDSLTNELHGVGSLNGSTQVQDFARLYTSMPILEDGLSSGHASDTENNNPNFPKKAVIENKIDTSDLTDLTKFVASTTKTERLEEDTTLNKDEGAYAAGTTDVEATLRDIRTTLQRTKTLLSTTSNSDNPNIINESNEREHTESPVWVPRNMHNSEESITSENALKPFSHEEDEADTDLETDRLLGQQRLDDLGISEEKWCDTDLKSPKQQQNIPITFSSATIRHGIGTSLTPSSPQGPGTENAIDSTNINSPEKLVKSSPNKLKEANKNKEVRCWDPAVLIEGVLFRAKYLGSTQLVCEGQPTKSTRMIQAEEAVSRIKAPEGETQPSTEVDLFISTEKIMILNTNLKEIMMDYTLRAISYIADIGDLVVLMARRRFVAQDNEDAPKPNRTPKMICHVFESDEAQFIAQSIGQAFQVAYVEYLKANGVDEPGIKEMDYQEVLNSQEIFGDELEIFARKELQKEVVVPKIKGEILGVVIVESGWGSMLPTVVIANLLSTGAAARCGQLNIGDQIIAINGLSLVGLPLSTCQSYIRNTKTQTAVKFTVVPCPPVVEVKIKRPNTKYQLGFSVQNGVICSLLRGGIAERGGVRVGHRIIEINNQSVVAVAHEKIVSILATSVGEILMKTMPTSMFRLLTGQENPLYI